LAAQPDYKMHRYLTSWLHRDCNKMPRYVVDCEFISYQHAVVHKCSFSWFLCYIRIGEEPKL